VIWPKVALFAAIGALGTAIVVGLAQEALKDRQIKRGKR
jgi:hypothetical protein